jgi:hypothetical protein
MFTHPLRAWSCALAVLLTALAAPVPARAEDGGGAEVLVIGRSREGRPIEVWHRAGPGEATFRVLVVGAIHGDETAGMAVVDSLAAADLPDGLDLWLVPDGNPDGSARRTRGNAAGVDLNRNFPSEWLPYGSDEFTVGGYDPGASPASEPETVALMGLIEAIQPSYTIWYHRPWNAAVCGPWSGARCRAYAAAVGLAVISAPRPGSATSWQASQGQQAAVVEFGEGALSEDEVAAHVDAVLALPSEPPPPQPGKPGQPGDESGGAGSSGRPSGEVTVPTVAPTTTAPPPEPPAPPPPPPPVFEDAAVVYQSDGGVPPGAPVGAARDVVLVAQVRNGGGTPAVATVAWWAPCAEAGGSPRSAARQTVEPGAAFEATCRVAGGAGRALDVRWSASLSGTDGRSRRVDSRFAALGGEAATETIGSAGG